MATKTREITLKLKVAFDHPNGDNGHAVTLQCDYADDRNKEWAPYTPFAQLQMTVKNEYAEQLLKPGRNFLVTLTPEDEIS